MSDAGRTEAAATAAHDHEFGPSYPWEAAQLAESVLAAADEHDREHGIVRVDTRDEALVQNVRDRTATRCPRGHPL